MDMVVEGTEAMGEEGMGMGGVMGGGEEGMDMDVVDIMGGGEGMDMEGAVDMDMEGAVDIMDGSLVSSKDCVFVHVVLPLWFYCLAQAASRYIKRQFI